MTRVTANKKRGTVVFGRLLEALKNNEYPYTVGVLPQHRIPNEIRDDPLVHARFLFYLCHYMRGAIKSNLATQRLVALWKEKPWFFEPAFFENATRDEVEKELAYVLNYQTKQIASFWIENSRRLEVRWGGDPRNIFKGARHGDVVRERIMNRAAKRMRAHNGELQLEPGFLGFQGKMASMLSYFLMEAKLVNPIAIAPAVDFHLLRIMLSTGVLTVKPEYWGTSLYDYAHAAGTSVLEAYGERKHVHPVEIGDALWILSTTLCSKAPGNASMGRSKERGVGGRKALPKSRNVDAYNLQHQELYARSCGVCPAEKFCTLNLPSGPYYEGGGFYLRRRERVGHPNLFGKGALPVQLKPACEAE